MQAVIIKKKVRFLLMLENTRVTAEKIFRWKKITKIMSFWHGIVFRRETVLSDLASLEQSDG